MLSTLRIVPGIALAIAVGSPADGQQAADRAVSLQVAKQYTVGGVDAPSWASFVDLQQVGFGWNGELWAVDTRGRQIVRVAADGRSGRNLVRRGKGPGEFESPKIVADIVNRNLQLLDQDGSLLVATRAVGFLRPARIERLQGDDFIAVPEVLFLDGEARAAGPDGWKPIERLPILRFRMQQGPEVQTLTTARYTQPPRTSRPYSSHGFQPHVYWAVHSGRIAIVDGVDYVVRVHEGSGRQLGTIRRAIEPRRPSRADVAAARRQARARLISPDGVPLVAGARGGGGGAAGPRNARALLERIEAGLDAMTFNERVPVVIGLSYDREGRLWVARTPPVWGERPFLDMFAPGGNYLGTTRDLPRLPDAWGPGGLAAFIEKDELDVAYVSVVRVETLRLDRA